MGLEMMEIIGMEKSKTQELNALPEHISIFLNIDF
jgi:hypothetical protein